MTRLFRWALAGAFGLAVAACVPEFETPLSEGPAADPAVLGTWNAASEGDDQTMIIEVAAEGEGISVILRDPKGSEEHLAFKGRTAEANGVHYASLTPADPEKMGAGDTKVGYLLFRYEAAGDTIKVWSLDTEAVGKAVESGKLKGTVTGSGSDTQPKITASSAEVAAFLSTDEGQAAFKNAAPDDVLIMKRAAP
ncbi:MAG: hypothetical protein QM698_04930 [Micropepsaceae bacterium]